MTHYRLYYMNPHSGHIDRLAEIEAPDDSAALALAARHRGEMPLELWQLHRKVGRFEARPMAAAFARPAATESHWADLFVPGLSEG